MVEKSRHSSLARLGLDMVWLQKVVGESAGLTVWNHQNETYLRWTRIDQSHGSHRLTGSDNGPSCRSAVLFMSRKIHLFKYNVSDLHVAVVCIAAQKLKLQEALLESPQIICTCSIGHRRFGRMQFHSDSKDRAYEPGTRVGACPRDGSNRQICSHGCLQGGVRCGSPLS